MVIYLKTWKYMLVFCNIIKNLNNYFFHYKKIKYSSVYNNLKRVLGSRKNKKQKKYSEWYALFPLNRLRVYSTCVYNIIIVLKYWNNSKYRPRVFFLKFKLLHIDFHSHYFFFYLNNAHLYYIMQILIV